MLPLSLRREVITKRIEKVQLRQTQVMMPQDSGQSCVSFTCHLLYEAKGNANRDFKILSQAYYFVTSLVLSSQEMDECRLPNITCWKKWCSCIGCDYSLAGIYAFSSLVVHNRMLIASKLVKYYMVWLWHSGAPYAFAVLWFLRKKKGENFLCRLQLCGVYLGS
jgi:hypothetical protein